MTLRKRVEYIDGLRGLAVVSMFFVHAAVAWLSPEARRGSHWSWSMSVSGMVAPTFLFLAGLSMALVADRELAAGVDPRASQRRIVRRGLEIVALGYGLHLAFFALDGFEGDWARVFKVDVLHCIGLSMIVFSRLAWPSKKVNWRAGSAYLLLPVLAWFAYRLPLDQWLPPGVSGYLTTKSTLALFPFVPYAAWMGLGLFVAPFWLAALRTPRDERRFALGLAFAGVLLLVGGNALGHFYYAWSLDSLGIDPATDAGQSKGLVHLFWTKGALVFFFFSIAVFTRRVWRARAAKALLLFGKRSLFAYGAHLVLIYPVAGRFLSERLSPWQHSVLSASLTVVMYGLVVLSGRLDLAATWRRRASISKRLGDDVLPNLAPAAPEPSRVAHADEE